MSQTRAGSFIEAWANIGVGYGVNFAANMLILPLFGFNVTALDSALIGGIFTGVSLVRSYFLRRVFDGIGRFNK